MVSIVTFSIEENQLPKHTPEDFREWVEFKIGARHDIKDSNPLAERDLHEFRVVVRQIVKA
jgi:hypothetical protein